MMGSRSRYIMHYPNVLEVWPFKIGTNLFQAEVQGLEAIGFKLEDGTGSEVQMVLDSSFIKEEDSNLRTIEIDFVGQDVSMYKEMSLMSQDPLTRLETIVQL